MAAQSNRVSNARVAALISGLAMMVISGKAQGDVIDAHPNAQQLKAIFTAQLPENFEPTGISRNDYLKLIAGNVDFFKTCQDKIGAIIDPVSKGERQYSTPAFAAAASVLARNAGRTDLIDPASRALTCALTALIEKRPADKHADFYIPLLVHAYRSLEGMVPAEQSAAWGADFKKIDPETMYRADLRGMNWNVVSSSGELLRRASGLVTPENADRQMAYLESCLAGHLKTLTPLGLFEDPGAPMAYDAFSRLWLEDVYADKAYSGKYADTIGTFLRTGGLSTLLMLSPTGEWPTGGRSSMHNWTDAEVLAICEMNAAYWQQQGRADVAGAFKRAAHLAFQSVARWQRPSGELWIIKNRAEPSTRLAYEPYSNHSQYNLLPMAMLAIAYDRADETIAERPSPSEVGGYVFDARQTFHKVIAAAGGYYVEIDTAADGHYNATGLQRIHKTGVPFPALSDTSAPERAYDAKNGPKAAVALGLQWQTSAGAWIGLADFLGGKEGNSVTSADLNSLQIKPEQVNFEVEYKLAGKDSTGQSVLERYTLSPDGVTQASTFTGDAKQLRIQVPVLVSDGAADLKEDVKGDAISITNQHSITEIMPAKDGLAGTLQVAGPRLVTHNGYIQAATAGLTGKSATVTVRLRNE